MKYASRRSHINNNKQKKSNRPFFSPKPITIQTKDKIDILQLKLKVGKAGDKYEKEADAMADRVMSMPQSGNSIQLKPKYGKDEELQKKPLAASITPLVQKQSNRNEEETLQTQSMEEEEETLQMQSEEEEEAIQAKSNGSEFIATTTTASQLRSSKGGGSNLPDSTNQFMSNSFGTDFSNVRIHTGSNAVQMNQNLNARAFTNGRDIYFNKGQYNPQSKAGKKLLAHELTHVVQQGYNKMDASIQRYTVPGKLSCRRLVNWLNTNSPYAPEWAETKVNYESSPSNFGMIKFKKIRGGVMARVKGNPKTIVKMKAPIDMPSWNPDKRPNRKAELKAWNQMLVALNKHESEHRRIGKSWQAKLQNKQRTLRFVVKGKNQNEALNKAALKLTNKGVQWQKDAQSAQDNFDAKTNHGQKAIKGFPAVKLVCP